MTSLNTEITSAGELLSDATGQTVATINWDVGATGSATRWRYEFLARKTVTRFASREAAEFRALSDYAEHMAATRY